MAAAGNKEAAQAQSGHFVSGVFLGVSWGVRAFAGAAGLEFEFFTFYVGRIVRACSEPCRKEKEGKGMKGKKEGRKRKKERMQGRGRSQMRGGLRAWWIVGVVGAARGGLWWVVGVVVGCGGLW
jgi:hypothetical protein